MAIRQKSIEDLRVYTASRELEDRVYELVRSLPQVEFYRLGNDLRRSSAGASHYIAEAHRRYSLGLKVEALHLARTEIDQLKQLLNDYSERGYGSSDQLKANCTAITKQLWGLIKYLRGRQALKATAFSAMAVDELVASRH